MVLPQFTLGNFVSSPTVRSFHANDVLACSSVRVVRMQACNLTSEGLNGQGPDRPVHLSSKGSSDQMKTYINFVA